LVRNHGRLGLHGVIRLLYRHANTWELNENSVLSVAKAPQS